MTIACAWWDESDGLRRITAIADSRAAVEKDDGEWEPLSELTVKLFAIQLRCHEFPNGLDTQRGGAWTNPYYVTEVGIAFAGYCFEALTIIAIIDKYLGSLATVGSPSLPEPKSIVGFISAIVELYLKQHRNPAMQTVQFLIFGFTPDAGSPWLAELAYRKGTKTKGALHLDFGKEGALFCIGDADICGEIEGQRTLRDIRKHSAELKEGTDSESKFEYDREQGRMSIAERKSIEEMILQKINSKYAATVGGSLQKIELHVAGNATVSSYTDDRNLRFADSLPNLNSDGLQYIPIVQAMGRNAR